MNLIYLLDNKHWGTAPQYVADIASAMSKAGHRTSVVCAKTTRITARLSATGAEILPFSYSDPLRLLTTLKLSGLLRNSSGRTIIHANDIRTASVAIGAREASNNRDAKIVLTLHDLSANPLHDASERILEKVDAIIVPSALSRDELARRFPNTDAGKLYPLPYSVPCLPKNAKHVDRNRPTFVFHGNITPAKGISEFFEASSAITDLDFGIEIIGEGTARDVMPLKQTVQRLDLTDRVEWLGYRDDARQLLGGATAGVYLSPDRSPLALKECLLAGVPVITNRDRLSEALRQTLTDTDYRLALASQYASLEPVPYTEFISYMTSIYSRLL